MSINKSKARKLAEFLRNLTEDAKINDDGLEQSKVSTRVDLESKTDDTESLVTPAAVTSYVGNKLGEYVHETHDIALTFTGDVTGSGTITDMGDTSFSLTLDAETLPDQAGFSGYFLTTDGSRASWAEVDLSGYVSSNGYNNANWDTAFGWGNHAAEGYLVANDIPTYTRESFTTTENQTTFTVTNGYTPSHVQVFYNGVLLNTTNYSAIDGSTIVLSENFTRAGDEIVVVSSLSTLPEAPGLERLYFTAGGVTKNLTPYNQYFQFNAGSGISVSYTTDGNGTENNPYDLTISHADTSTESTENNTGTDNFIQTIVLDGNGHVTGIQSKSLEDDFRVVQKNLSGKVILNAGNIEDALGRDYVQQTLRGSVAFNFPQDGQILSYVDSSSSFAWIDPPVAAPAEEESIPSLFRVTTESSTTNNNSIILSPNATPVDTSSSTLVIVGAYTSNGSFDPGYTYCCWNDVRYTNTLRMASSNYNSYNSSSSVINNGGLYFSYDPNNSAAIGFVAYIDSDGWADVQVRSTYAGTSASISSSPTFYFPTQEGEVYLIVKTNIGDGSNLYLSNGVTLDSVEYYGAASILKLSLNQSATEDNWFIDWGSYGYVSYVYSYILKGDY